MEETAKHHKIRLTRKQMMAADIFGYSYAHYEDHLGNVRFDKMMPSDVDKLERAEREGWDALRLAKVLEIPEDRVASFQRAYREAKEIMDAPTPAESFRRGVRFSIQNALKEGLKDTGSIERLVTQICYRTADLAFRLDTTGKQLSEYSEELRQETKFDSEIWNEEFNVLKKVIDDENEAKEAD